MSMFNEKLAQNAFNKYNAGLREQVESIYEDFDNPQAFVNFVRSKLNSLYIMKARKIFKKESEILRMKSQLKKANELINQCDNYLMILENSTSSADLCNDVISFRESLKEMKGEL